jgi:dihydropteroate synthase
MMQLVGILNITPDSFSDGGQFVDPRRAIDQAEQLFRDGASLVDIGAESTRPGAVAISADEEWQRLEPILTALLERYPRQLSVDTYHPETADWVLEMGDVILNDVTGMNNLAMVAVVVKHKARCIISHLQGVDIQAAHQGALIDDQQVVVDDLLSREAALITAGLPPEHIILDPGIGFGKTPELNRRLLRFAAAVPGKTVMIGYSRKRFLGDHRMTLEPNLEAARVAVEAGAAYLRVHDVAGHKRGLGL